MKFPDDVEEHLETEIHQHKGRDTAPHGVPVPADLSLDEEYLAYLRGRAIPGANLKGLKLVLDCANGAASLLGPALFRSLGAEVIAIHNQPNGRNINDGCGSLHPEKLREKVLETRSALGVAFDGDADRAMFVSASGRSRGRRRSFACRGAIFQVRWAAARRPRDWHNDGQSGPRARPRCGGPEPGAGPVGDRYVLEEMLRSGANLGGEQSGHIIFLDDATTGDGLLTALKIACLVALRGPLDELVHGLKVFPQTIVNVQVKSKPPLESLPIVSAAIDKATKALGAAGRVVVRYSGTEPKARVMVEAEHAEDVTLWAETLASAIRAAIGA